jgi:hypothetical protein
LINQSSYECLDISLQMKKHLISKLAHVIKALTTITFDVALPHIPNLWNHLHELVEKLIDVAPISTLAYGQYSSVLVYIKDQLMVV